MIKKIVSAILVIITLTTTMVGCNKYPAKRSTFKERRVVMTLSLDGEEYKIRYELYRALFLNYKSLVDGGDDSVWSSDNSDEYVDKINEVIIGKASEIYSVFHLAEKIGIDPYSKDIKKQIQEYIRISVEGNGADVIGYGGDYDAYLDSLKQNNMNYAVQELMFRYEITLNLINEYFKGYEDKSLGHIAGEYDYSKEDVKNYYYSDGCVRVLHAYVDELYGASAKDRMEQIRAGMLKCSSELDIALYIINNTTVTAEDLIYTTADADGKVVRKANGVILGENTLGADYALYKDTAFQLEVGQTSDVFAINDGITTYYVLYKLEKTDEYFEDCYYDIASAYLDNIISEKLMEIADDLAESAEYTKKYSKIDHTDISM